MNGMRSPSPHADVPVARLRSGARQVAEEAECRLRRDCRLLHWSLFCEYHGGVLIVRGHLPTYYLKQVAQTIVASVDGVVKIDNRIEVVAVCSLTRR